MPVKLPCDLPTPDELTRAPELATLVLLEAALHVANHAIIAENMELFAQEDFVDHRQLLPSTQTAGGILDKLGELWHDCELYRRQRQEEVLARLRSPEDF